MNDIEFQFDLEDRGIIIERGQGLDKLHPDPFIKEQIQQSVIERNPSLTTSRNSKNQLNGEQSSNKII